MAEQEAQANSRVFMRSIMAVDEELLRANAAIERLIAIRDDLSRRQSTLREQLIKALLVEQAEEQFHYGEPAAPSPPSVGKPVFYASEDEVTGVARVALDIANEQPGRRWRSSEFIDEVIERSADVMGKDVSRGAVSTSLYRLRRSGLLGNDGTHVFSVKDQPPSDLHELLEEPLEQSIYDQDDFADLEDSSERGDAYVSF